jgi:hypothetical protein
VTAAVPLEGGAEESFVDIAVAGATAALEPADGREAVAGPKPPPANAELSAGVGMAAANELRPRLLASYAGKPLVPLAPSAPVSDICPSSRCFEFLAMMD